MTGKPLRLNWSEIMPEEAASGPPELEVVASAPSGDAYASRFDASSSPMERSLTTAQLQEKVRRLEMNSGLWRNLSDKGQKLEAYLRLCREEIDRRNARIRKGDENCKKDAQSKVTESSVTSSNSIQPNSKCNLQPSFFSVVNQMLDKRAYSASKGKSLNKNQRQMHEKRPLHVIYSQCTRLSSRQAPSLSASVPASTEQRRSSGKGCNIIETYNFYAPCAGRRSSKRLKNSRGRDKMIPRSEKARNVVFLDEEDSQTKRPTRDASDDRKEPKMYYPSRDHPKSVELSYSDLKCLEPGQYLSSPIMNFYMLCSCLIRGLMAFSYSTSKGNNDGLRYLQRPLSPISNPKGEYYFFNTYFYGKLEEALSSMGDRSLRFSKLRRWWKGINLFEKAYIFLPIHRDLHWSLVIISIPPNEDESCPIILHLDSLDLHNSELILEVIHCYLIEEWKYMKQSTASANVPISEKIRVDFPQMIDKKKIKVPQQKNVYDCGLFVLYFMERFIEEAPKKLKREVLGMFGRNWFQPKDASSLRKRIKKLLLKEFASSIAQHGREECHEFPSTSSESYE